MKGKLVLLLILLNGFLFAESSLMSNVKRGDWYFLSGSNLFEFMGIWFNLFECDRNELRILRNSIYAKHGYIFASPDLQEYFGQLPWYTGTERDVESNITDNERFFISVIQKIEKNYPQVENDNITGLWVTKDDIGRPPFSLADLTDIYDILRKANIRIYPNGIFYYELNDISYLGLWSFNGGKFIINSLGAFNYFHDVNTVIGNINNNIRFTEYKINNSDTLLKCNFTNDHNEWIKLSNKPGDLLK